MKKISLFGAVSTGVGMLIATSCFFFVGKRLKCGRYTVRYCYRHSVYSKYACGFVDSRIKCDNA